jgi:hypothetical protein
VLKIAIEAPSDLHDQELAFWQNGLGQELPEIHSADMTAPSSAGPT